MYINDNIASLNAWRNLTATGNRMNSVLEHLSSGLRINKAADDAAGLAISQKMLAQVNGLDQATRNAQDAISLVQTAEGAMGQAQDILQRMRQLAVQASSDTETSSDRVQLQIEMDQLAKQLTDIANNTEFNTKRLLTGEFSSGQTNVSILVGANAGQNLSFNIGAVDAKTLQVSRDVADTATAPTYAGSTNATAAAFTPGTQNYYAVGTYTVQFTQDTGTGIFYAQLQDPNGNNIGSKVAVSDTSGNSLGGTVTVGDTAAGQAFDITLATAGTALAAGSGTITVQAATTSVAGSSSNSWNASAAGGLLLVTAGQASDALKAIDAAINTISGERAKLGATQNRLQYIINDLQITSQNLSDAKSRITDTDMAKEMAEFTKYQILQQAGVAMLAQANAMPQAVLKLLG
ncbi:MAG: flagellin [Firmicutes bacterium]|nr:flagellin [Bacillota bacterium]